MNVKTCRKCGKIFQHVVGPQLCELCKRSDEEDFQRVKDFLYDNPGASMPIVCEEADVTVRQVQRYLRQGRLTVSEDSPIGLDCQRCGRKITTGEYCDKCKNEMSNQFASTVKGMKKPEESSKKNSGNRMRFLDSDRF